MTGKNERVNKSELKSLSAGKLFELIGCIQSNILRFIEDLHVLSESQIWKCPGLHSVPKKSGVYVEGSTSAKENQWYWKEILTVCNIIIDDTEKNSSTL